MRDLAAVTEGQLSNGLPCLQLGKGPPLLVSPGLSSEHANPTGMRRRMALTWAAPFAQHFTVYLVQRKPGLASAATLSDVAADYAEAIERDLGQPVPLHGTSTGGSVALQIAIDHPQLVQRMVLAAAACRLSPHARRVQEQLARLTESGDARGASALLLGAMARLGAPYRRLPRAQTVTVHHGALAHLLGINAWHASEPLPFVSRTTARHCVLHRELACVHPGREVRTGYRRAPGRRTVMIQPAIVSVRRAWPTDGMGTAVSTAAPPKYATAWIANGTAARAPTARVQRGAHGESAMSSNAGT